MRKHTPQPSLSHMASRLKVIDTLMQAHLIHTFQAHQSQITSLAVVQKPRLVITASADGKLRVWNLETSNLHSQLEGYPGIPSCVAAFPSSTFVVSGGNDGTLVIWNSESSEHIRTMLKHRQRITAISMAPDRKRFASGDTSGTLCVWNSVSGQLQNFYHIHTSISSLTFMPDGRHLIVGSSDDSSQIIVIDITTGHIDKRFKDAHHGITSIAITADGQELITGSPDGDLAIWQWSEGAIRQTVETHMGTAVTAIMPNRRYAVIGTQTPRLTIWNLETGRHIHTLDTPSDWVSSLIITPDSRQILAGCHNGIINIYQLSHG